MTPELSGEDLLIEGIAPELLLQIEESARVHGRTVEDEARILIERGLFLEKSQR